MSKFNMTGQSAAGVATPSTGKTTIFVDSTTKKLKSKDDTGAVTDYSAVGSSITSLTGEVVASGPGAAAATLDNNSVIAKVLTGLSASTGTIVATDSIVEAFGKLLNQQSMLSFIASDGPVVVSSDITLVRDMYYSSLQVDVGATIFTAGFRIFCTGNAVINGTIDRSGSNATGTAATTGLVAGTLGSAGAGGAGGTAAGSAGGASAIALGGAGGAGGSGSGGGGGAAGTLTVVTAAAGGLEVLQTFNRAIIGQTTANTIITGGSGGGGAGGDGVAGGAGGAGGGVLVLVAKNISGTGTLRAKGGDGFQPITGGNKGGGGGGGGGVIVTVCQNDITATSIVFNVAGGAGASGTGTGASGSNGSNGRTFKIRA